MWNILLYVLFYVICYFFLLKKKIAHTCLQLTHDDAAVRLSSECHHWRLSQRHLWPCHCSLLLRHNLYRDTINKQYKTTLQAHMDGSTTTLSLFLPQAKNKKNYQSSFTERGLREADDCGFARCAAANRVSGGGERRPQHHGSQGFWRGGCCLGAALRLQTLLDEGLNVGGHLPQHREASLQPDKIQKQSIFKITLPDNVNVNDFDPRTLYFFLSYSDKQWAALKASRENW